MGKRSCENFCWVVIFLTFELGPALTQTTPFFWLILTVLGHIYNFARATWGLGWQKHGEKELRTFLLGCFFLTFELGPVLT